MICYLGDARSSMSTVRASGDFFETLIENNSATIQEVVQAVLEDFSEYVLLNRARGGMRFSLMVIHAHGRPGSLQLGSGLNIATAAPFAQLHRYFLYHAQPGQQPTRGQGIEIHGCNVAANEPVGPNFLMRLANLTGQCVTGGVMLQYGDPSWNFEGPTVTAHPHDGFYHNLFAGPPGPPA